MRFSTYLESNNLFSGNGKVFASVPLMAALFSVLAGTASAATIHVPSDQPTIQQAIDAASNGDLVLVSPGIYLEKINYHGKAITLQSVAGPEQTIIDGDHHGTVVTLNSQEGPQSVLRGFTIRFGSASYGGGILLGFGTSPVIAQNIFSENIQVVGGWGAAISGNGSSPRIEGNTFVANTCDAQHLAGVISFVNNSSPFILNNVFRDNPCGAITLAGGTPVIVFNTIARNSIGVRIEMGGNPNQFFANNLLFGNGLGLVQEFGNFGNAPTWSNNLVFNSTLNYSGLPDQTGVSGNISADPLFVEADPSFRLQSRSPAIDAGTVKAPGLPELDFLGQPRLVDGNRDGYTVPDIGACEFSLIDSTPTPTPTLTPIPTPPPAAIIRVPADQPTIQGAINVAGNGCLILVSPGIYFEHINYLGKAISIQSTGGAEQTIIDGGGTFGPVVTFATLEGSRSSLTGFTVQHGHADFGAGIMLAGASPTISQNIFKDNGQGSGGFGAAIGGNPSSAWIERNTFVANTCDTQFTAGVVSFVNSSSPHLINNIFRDNPCCAINMILPAGSAPVVANNTVVRNRVGVRVGAGVVTFGHLYANNILVGNGIALQVDSLSPGQEPRWQNNLVFKNTINFLGIASQTGLNGNISQDPLFAEGNSEFQLQVGSPAIDAGTLSVPSLPSTDLVGKSRVVDGDRNGSALPDMGAREFKMRGVSVEGSFELPAPPAN